MNHKDLVAWQKAMDLVLKVYTVSKEFPSEEKFGLTNQIRRAAVSIPSNIAEGAAERTIKDNLRFLSQALGSANELENQLLICERLQYIHNNYIIAELIEVRKLIYGLINHFKSKRQ
jgi:four helix bundle protein